MVILKNLREKYGVRAGSRLITREHAGNAVLIPVTSYERPTEALRGSVKMSQPIDEPKKIAREHVRLKLTEEFT